jgi:hypothetical protein
MDVHNKMGIHRKFSWVLKSLLTYVVAAYGYRIAASIEHASHINGPNATAVLLHDVSNV